MISKDKNLTINEHFMQHCIKLGKEALKNGNPPVGAIIVCEGKVIGEGQESGKTSGDITDHAEILAVRDAISNGYVNELSKSSLYTTHEPCLMCSYLIRHHQIPKLIYGVAVDFIGGHTSNFDVLSATDVPNWKTKPEIIYGILEQECIALNNLFKEASKQKP